MVGAKSGYNNSGAGITGGVTNIENWEQYGLVYALGKALRNRWSWAGETHIQKTGYFLQELLRAPLGCRFILYKHGPFSFDLRDTLAAMEALELIGWEPRPAPYGPSIVPGPQSKFLGALSTSPKIYRAQIDYVADRLAGRQVVELERLGTALYVTLEAETSPEDRAKEIVRLKPHVDPADARLAVEDLDRILAEVNEKQLAVRTRSAGSA